MIIYLNSCLFAAGVSSFNIIVIEKKKNEKQTKLHHTSAQFEKEEKLNMHA